MRTAAVVAEVGGGDWRDAVNALRPVTSELWAALPRDEQRRFVDRLARFWDIHRHRLAPQVATAVEELRASGRLTIASGRIRAVAAAADGVKVTVGDRATGQARTLRVASVVNCTGPTGNVLAGGSRLLETLCAAGTVRPHPLGTRPRHRRRRLGARRTRSRVGDALRARPAAPRRALGVDRGARDPRAGAGARPARSRRRARSAAWS